MKDVSTNRMGLPVRQSNMHSVIVYGPNDVQFQDQEFTWEQAVRILSKNSRFALLLGSGFMAVIVVAVLLMRDVYQPVSRLEIASPTSGIKTLHEIESTTDAENQDYLETQAQILKSDALAVSVIRELHLDKNPEFGNGTGTAESNPKASSAESQANSRLRENPYLREQLELALLTPSEARALEQFRRGLSVDVVRNTRLVEVSYAAHDPQLAQGITNTTVAKFIDNSYKQRYTTTMQASEWLSSQLSDLRKKVESSNQAVSDFQRKYGLIELDDRDVPMSQLMGEVNHQLSESQANRIESEAFLRMVELGQADSVPLLRDDQVYQNLLMKYADLRGQLAQARAVYGDANSNIKKLEDQSGEIAKQIDAERARMTERIRTSYAAAKEREKLMLQSREKLRAQMGNVSSQLVGYHVLKNEAIANSELYNMLQGRLKEAGIYAGLRSGNIRVVDLATNLQRATGPHRGLIIISGALMSLFVAILACFLRESLNNTLRTPDDVKFWTGMRSLALLPEMKPSKEPITFLNNVSETPASSGNGDSGNLARRPVTIMKTATAESEAIRDLRTSLLSGRPEKAPKVFLVSSSMEGEGKTTVAVNFAIALSQLGRTCLVDADLRQPMVASAFGITSNLGLSDILRGTSSLNGVMVSLPSVSNLAIVPSGGSVASPVDNLASIQMGNVFTTLREEFEYVVIDSPPVIRFSDARFLSRLADEVILVGRYGITTRRAIRRTAELLQEANAPVAGVVLNGIDLSSPDYHYFTYGYSKGLNGRNGAGSDKSADSTIHTTDDSKPKSKGAYA
jgi:succinoglycan biosynthesis transport protein ExoP